MNIALEKTEEYVNGAKRRSYGDAFVRGNNGTDTPPPKKITARHDVSDFLLISSHVHCCPLASLSKSFSQGQDRWPFEDVRRRS